MTPRDALIELLNELQAKVLANDEDDNRPLILAFEDELHMLGSPVVLVDEVLQLIANVIAHLQYINPEMLSVFTKHAMKMLAEAQDTHVPPTKH